MQEGPQIEALVRQLRRAWAGRRIVGVPDGVQGGLQRHLWNVSDADLLPRLAGAAVQEVRRVGKHVLLVLRRGPNPYRWIVLQLHLSASGWLHPANAAAREAVGDLLAPQEHANFPAERMPDLFLVEFDDGQTWAYRDQRRWGRIRLWSYAELAQGRIAGLARNGPDWIEHPKAAVAAVSHFLPQSRRAVKDVLLDQTVAAGLGNVLANEACFLAAVHPHEEWRRLTPGARAALARCCAAEALRRAVGGPSPTWAHGREGDWCLRAGCRGSISATRDRTNPALRVFFCPLCQTRLDP